MGMGEFGHGWGVWLWWGLIGAGVVWFLWMLPTFGKPRRRDPVDAEDLRRRHEKGEFDHEELKRRSALLRDNSR